jgi:hypothetical protein
LAVLQGHIKAVKEHSEADTSVLLELQVLLTTISGPYCKNHPTVLQLNTVLVVFVV